MNDKIEALEKELESIIEKVWSSEMGTPSTNSERYAKIAQAIATYITENYVRKDEVELIREITYAYLEYKKNPEMGEENYISHYCINFIAKALCSRGKEIVKI